MTAEQRWDLLFEAKGDHINVGRCPCPRWHNPGFEDMKLNGGYGLAGTPYLQNGSAE